MAFVDLSPPHADRLRRHGLAAADAFLAWAGVVVSGHPPGRHVERVELAGARYYLKKEHRVPWRERFHSAWRGLGWSSRSVREGRLLRQLRAAGVACPEVAAVGEDRHNAFLLVCEQPGFQELRTWLEPRAGGPGWEGEAPAEPRASQPGKPDHSSARDGSPAARREPRPPTAVDRRALADMLGRELARVHRAGFDHPDLYAKHVLVGRDADGWRVCFLDWQRSRRYRRVPWRRRLHDLAALDASLADGLASDRLRFRALRAYLAASDADGAPPLRRAAAAVRRLSRPLLARRKVREQRQPPLPAGAQDLVRLDGDRLCATRAFHDELHGYLPDWLLHTPARPAAAVTREPVTLPTGRPAVLVRCWQTATTSPRVEGLGATLFRVQRFGVPTPRVLALGHAPPGPDLHYSFVLVEEPTAVPLSPAAHRPLLRQAGRLLRQLHEAGYTLRRPLAGLGVAAGRVLLCDATALQRTPAADRPRDFADVAWSRTDRLRLALGYLGRPRVDAAVRALVGGERQVPA